MSLEASIHKVVSKEEWYNDGLVVIVVGASGDLAKKKTYPSLFALYAGGLLPHDTIIWGYARSVKTHQELRDQIKPYLPQNNQKTTDFLEKCYYKSGKSYGDIKAWTELVGYISEHEQQSNNNNNNRLFYMAIPPNVFGETGVAIRKTALHERGWSRVVIEKPFGRDLDSCRELMRVLDENFEEHHLYRIDHYLGKEMVQNLLVWRFGNNLFEWHRDKVESVHISFKEPFGTAGRDGYFDPYGIVRDVIQNHLLQVLTLVAMEPPVRVEGDYIRDAKTRVLQAMTTPKDFILGQYEGYFPEKPESNTPTYAAIRCFVHTPRWDGVPFVLEAGKALNERKCEVCIRFRPGGTATTLFPNVPPNELVMRIQPNASISLRTNVKSPGFASQPTPAALQMDHHPNGPDAYTRLILDVLRGRQASFVRNDELERSWEIFTPLLDEMEHVVPTTYPQGSEGPSERRAFLDTGVPPQSAL